MAHITENWGRLRMVCALFIIDRTCTLRDSRISQDCGCQIDLPHLVNSFHPVSRIGQPKLKEGSAVVPEGTAGYLRRIGGKSPSAADITPEAPQEHFKPSILIPRARIAIHESHSAIFACAYARSHSEVVLTGESYRHLRNQRNNASVAHNVCIL